ncbi:Integrase, catalytic region [Leifsonia rubra CMS 76R]|nr:Integrase, catalytic region [Leifsonia rubra CMS 76R]
MLITAQIHTAWESGNSVDHGFASAWDDGVMLASRRSWWRIAAEIEDQSARPLSPTRATGRAPREAPVLRATGPGQVWSWDITDLRMPWRGMAFKAYSIIDIHARKLVGWRVENREVDDLAVEMFQEAFARHGLPDVVHADSGAAMRSGAMQKLLGELNIGMTHNRPSVSNDNPFSESEFRTMKYRPNYPGTFTDLETVRAWVDAYSTWYNQQHRHSGIALFTPDSVFDGSWRELWQRRDAVHQAYYEVHPERFHHRPITPAPESVVGINLPDDDATQAHERLHAA